MIICIKYCKINSAEPLVMNKEKPTLVYNKFLFDFFSAVAQVMDFSAQHSSQL